MTCAYEIHVFVGPSLCQEDRAAFADFSFRPPIAEGDMFRAVDQGAAVVAIVDGFFETRAAVWHKEILWTLAQGVPVYGASSIGALRAAELDLYGMQGIGVIYDAYACGHYDADAEIAVVHGPQELGFPPVSEALVNIRATLGKALSVFAVSSADAEMVLAAARSLFFKERSWPNICEALIAQGLESDMATQLVATLEAHRVDQKRADALLLLQHLGSLVGQRRGRRHPAAEALPETPAFRLAKARALKPANLQP